MTPLADTLIRVELSAADGGEKKPVVYEWGGGGGWVGAGGRRRHPRRSGWRSTWSARRRRVMSGVFACRRPPVAGVVASDATVDFYEHLISSPVAPSFSSSSRGR